MRAIRSSLYALGQRDCGDEHRLSVCGVPGMRWRDPWKAPLAHILYVDSRESVRWFVFFVDVDITVEVFLDKSSDPWPSEVEFLDALRAELAHDFALYRAAPSSVAPSVRALFEEHLVPIEAS